MRQRVSVSLAVGALGSVNEARFLFVRLSSMASIPELYLLSDF
jgi:hypothetical protein